MHNTGSLPVQRARWEGIGRDAGCAALRWMICKKNTIIKYIKSHRLHVSGDGHPRSPLALVRGELPATAAIESQDLLVVLARGRLVVGLYPIVTHVMS